MVPGTKDRLYVTPGTYGLPNTIAGLKEAERRALNKALSDLAPTIRNVNPTAAPPTAHAAPAAEEVPTFAEYGARWLELAKADNKPATIRGKTFFLAKACAVFGSLRLDQVDQLAVDSWRAALARDYSAVSANLNLIYLGGFLRSAVEHKVLREAPRVRLLKEPPRKTRFLSYDECDKLVATCEGQLRTLVFLGMTSGLRIGELLALRWENVDLDRGNLHVCQSYDYIAGSTHAPKSGRSRDVPIPDVTIAALRAHQHDRGPLVFCGPTGTHLSQPSLYRQFSNALKRAEIPQAGFHILRHTYASHLALVPVDILAIRDLLGHADLAETQRYAHLSRSHLTNAVRSFDRRHAATPASDVTTSAPTTSALTTSPTSSSTTLPAADLSLVAA